MDFSEEWRSLWSVSSVFAAPSLLPSGSDPVGPLFFSPSPSPPVPLLSSPSLALQIPPPLPDSSYFDGLRCFFRCPDNEAFLPYATISALANEAALSDAGPSASDPLPSNSLAALRCRDGSSMVLFFPTGSNANWIGYVGLSFRGTTPPQLSADRGADIFKLKEGYKHPYHRILKMSVVAAQSSSWLPEEASVTPGNPLVEGFLIATTLYSVNWFRVETRISEFTQKRPFLFPLAKQGFEAPVVHACWSPHFSEESAALLESGELCWFNLQTKHCGTTRLTLSGEDNPGEWLSCEFGGQPWIVIVACSKTVLLVDLRSTRGTVYKVLAQIEMPSTLNVAPLMEVNDRFIAFCKASYNDIHFAMVTEHRLLLFDVRKPLFPVLTWSHGMEFPCYIAMFRLSDLRLSDEFKWAAESGFAILLGCFWNNAFNFFIYGPRNADTVVNSSLYAWELPYAFILSGGGLSGDCFVREIFSEENPPYRPAWKRRENLVVGFCMVPNDIFATDSRSGGFSLVRLTLSGKLEMQRYHASSKLPCQEINFKEDDHLEVEDSNVYCKSYLSKVHANYFPCKLRYLYEYMNGNLSNALRKCDKQSSIGETCQISLGPEMDKLTSQIQNSADLSVSAIINEVTLPTSIFEVACRRALHCLQSNILPLAFSKYSDLFTMHGCSTFEFLEIPFSSNKSFLPFFAAKPSTRGEKWMNSFIPEQTLVGPVLPVPVLLALQKNDMNNPSTFQEDPDADLLDNHCRTILKDVYPEISIADTTKSTAFAAADEQQSENPYFVYEPAQTCAWSNSKGMGISSAGQVKQESQMEQTYSLSYKDKRFSTFLCGLADRGSHPNSKSENIGDELFDLSPVRLDFDINHVELEPAEQKIFEDLSRQFSKWQKNYKPYQDFCSSYKI